MAKRTSNGKALVIVESPAKAKTINKYLGRDFVVKASMGHVRDLPPKDFGIDVSKAFEPTYEVVSSRSKVVTELKKLANQAPEVYLATDLDREGEAIAWHLAEALNLPDEKTRRVIFNQITAGAIKEAFSHPHRIDLGRVNAQQARRILDRIVGYELSPLLWRKIAKGLSAGRVQSVAVRLIVNREREIRAFIPEESWKISACFAADLSRLAENRDAWREYASTERTQKELQRWLSEHGCFRAELAEVGGQPFNATSADDARAVVEALGYDVSDVQKKLWQEYKHLDLHQIELVGGIATGRLPDFNVAEIKTRRTNTKPPGPFTTATLQQQASTRLGYSASRTMQIAQSLYEGIDLTGEGPVGLITYMRTDSTNLSGDALSTVRGFIDGEFGDKYLPEKPNFYGKRQARTQEAHEAIRPTDPNRTPDKIRSALSPAQYRLYDLIWRRFVACQMTPAEWDSTSVGITCDTSRGVARFNASGRRLVFDGFMRVSGVSSEDQILPELEEGRTVGALSIDPKQQFTSPPPRYNEASLVKTLESEGIGRPSTYAAIIETIQDRGYVIQEERKFYPTALGELVTDKLVEHFPKIMDIKFTSYMEDELDKIEEDQLDWVQVLHEFYDPFRELLNKAGDAMEPAKSQPSDHSCPECGAPMVYRWSKVGRFLACSRYPDCTGKQNVDRHGEPVKPVKEEELTKPCPDCERGTLRVKRKGRRTFMACDRYPECKFTEGIPESVVIERKPTPPPEQAGVACEKCGSAMLIREGSRGKFLGCSKFPRCRNTHPYEKLEELRAKSPMEITEPASNGNGSSAASRTPLAPDGKAVGAKAKGKKVEDLGDPPEGFAWTRTGRPVVETLPEEDLFCPNCSSKMEMKRGRFGPFFSCTNFPKCKFNANLRGEAKKQAEEMMPAPSRPKPIPTDIECDDCGSKMVIRRGRRGHFLGCTNYPKCKATSELPPGYDVEKAAAAAGITIEAK